MKNFLYMLLVLIPFINYGQNEVLINSYISNNQRDPQIVTDNHGNILVVWTSYNQISDTTKEDIIESHIKIKEISKNLKIDFAFTSVLNLNFNNKKENLESNKIIKKNELFYLDKLIKIF